MRFGSMFNVIYSNCCDENIRQKLNHNLLIVVQQSRNKVDNIEMSTNDL